MAIADSSDQTVSLHFCDLQLPILFALPPPSIIQDSSLKNQSIAPNIACNLAETALKVLLQFQSLCVIPFLSFDGRENWAAIVKFPSNEGRTIVEIHDRLLQKFQEHNYSYTLYTVCESVWVFKTGHTWVLDEHRTRQPRLEHVHCKSPLFSRLSALRTDRWLFM
jgi:hypothetical protein